MTCKEYVSGKKIKEHVISFIAGAIIGYFVFFVAAVIQDVASWKQIMIPSLAVGIAASVWKDKFMNFFLGIASWF